MAESTIRLLAAAAVAASGTACGGGIHQPGLPDARDECVLVAPGATPADSIVVLLEHTVDPRRAPVPSNRSERLVFDQAYESLVSVDCVGAEHPALAETWKREDRGRQWRFTLRAGASFADGSPVTAHDVVSSWRDRLPQDTTRPPSRLVRPESVTVVDDRTLSVALTRPIESPRVFAHPLLGVARSVDGSDWPLGTRAYRLGDAQGRESGQRVIVATPVRSGGALPVVQFRVSDGSDVRDHLDADVDLLVTEDLRALQYASSREGFVVRPLPWDRTYVLAVSGRRVSDDAAWGLSSSVRSALARDAVRAPSRGAASPYWWLDVEPCPVPAPRTVRPDQEPAANHIVYDHSDLVARDIAERLVALLDGALVDGARFDARRLFGSTADRAERFTAVGLDPERFVQALAIGNEPAYVAAIPRRALDGCAGVASLVAQMPWLAAEVPSQTPGQDAMTANRLRLARQLVPLVDTRADLIIRGERMGRMHLEWDGAVRWSGSVR